MYWMFLPLRRYFNFAGRSRRKEFWLFQLLHLLVAGGLIVMVLVGLPWAMMPDAKGQVPVERVNPITWLGMILFFLWGLGTIIPIIAVTIRRFHDHNRTGWLYLLNLVPLGGFVVLIFFLLEGTRGENRFGPDPKDPSESAVFE